MYGKFKKIIISQHTLIELSANITSPTRGQAPVTLQPDAYRKTSTSKIPNRQTTRNKDEISPSQQNKLVRKFTRDEKKIPFRHRASFAYSFGPTPTHNRLPRPSTATVKFSSTRKFAHPIHLRGFRKNWKTKLKYKNLLHFPIYQS